MLSILRRCFLVYLTSLPPVRAIKKDMLSCISWSKVGNARLKNLDRPITIYIEVTLDYYSKQV